MDQAHLRHIIDNRLPETARLEFKREMALDTPGKKKEADNEESKPADSGGGGGGGSGWAQASAVLVLSGASGVLSCWMAFSWGSLFTSKRPTLGQIPCGSVIFVREENRANALQAQS